MFEHTDALLLLALLSSAALREYHRHQFVQQLTSQHPQQWEVLGQPRSGWIRWLYMGSSQLSRYILKRGHTQLADPHSQRLGQRLFLATLADILIISLLLGSILWDLL